MSVAQVTYKYWPVRGGQEVYVSQLLRVLTDLGMAGEVFQPWNGEASSKRVVPPNIHLLRTPPFAGRLIPSIGQHVYNLYLACMRARLRRYDLVIVHYAFHALPLIGLRNLLVLSHGVEWHMVRPTLDDRARAFAARSLFGRVPLVANDTHYLRIHGIDAKPAAGMFTEVAPNRWFIPNCVDTEFFTDIPSVYAESAPRTILVPRQVTEDRGIKLAIEAFQIVKQVDPTLHMRIVGGPLKGKYYFECVELIKRLGLADSVQFAGFVDNSKMPDVYRAAHITLVPTLCREGTSLSALESMACGTATVSTNVAGLADLPCVQADPQPRALADAVLRTVGDARTCGHRQQATVRSVFNLDNWRRAWGQVLTRLARPDCAQ